MLLFISVNPVYHTVKSIGNLIFGN